MAFIYKILNNMRSDQLQEKISINKNMDGYLTTRINNIELPLQRKVCSQISFLGKELKFYNELPITVTNINAPFKSQFKSECCKQINSKCMTILRGE